MESIDALAYRLTYRPFREVVEDVADRLDYFSVTDACENNDCFGVIHDGVVAALPFERARSENIPWDPDFFLLTTHPQLAALFHEQRGKPVWFCEDLDALSKIQAPFNAGKKWAYILTECEEAWDAAIITEHYCYKGRVVSVLGGTCPDLMRTFFPEYWEKCGFTM